MCVSRWLWGVCTGLVLAGCLGGAGSGQQGGVPPVAAVEYALSASPYTSLQMVWMPTATPEALAAIDAAELTVTEPTRFAAAGLAVTAGPGEPWVEVSDLAPGWADYATSEARAAARSLLYFWQSADPQVIDEESPIRFAGVYAEALLFGSAYRPQDPYVVHVFESHVRTARRLAELGADGFDFAIITGDLTDTGQRNELRWVVDILNGGTIDPDTGVDDDPVPGAGNDFNDPFTSPGIGAPWYAVLGNHETLYIGTALMNNEIQAAATGDTVFESGLRVAFGLPEPFPGASPGYLDGSKPDAPIVTSGTTPADPDRRVLSTDEALSLLREAAGEPVGHGLGGGDAAAARGDFTFRPIADLPLRVIALNTVYRDAMADDLQGRPLEYSSGFWSADQRDWLQEQLDAAKAANELVIVASHHRPEDFNSASPIPGSRLAQILADAGNVVLHLTGHGHFNARTQQLTVDAVSAAGGYYELMLASTVDFPMQSRILELVDEGGGYLSVYVTNVDHNAAAGTPADTGRLYAAARRFFQDRDYREEWEARRGDRNLLLRWRMPDAIAAAVAVAPARPQVESLATLATLAVP